MTGEESVNREALTVGFDLLGSGKIFPLVSNNRLLEWKPNMLQVLR